MIHGCYQVVDLDLVNSVGVHYSEFPSKEGWRGEDDKSLAIQPSRTQESKRRMYDERHKGTRPWLYGTFFDALGITVARRNRELRRERGNSIWRSLILARTPNRKSVMFKVVHKEPAVQVFRTPERTDGRTTDQRRMRRRYRRQAAQGDWASRRSDRYPEGD